VSLYVKTKSAEGEVSYVKVLHISLYV